MCCFLFCEKITIDKFDAYSLLLESEVDMVIQYDTEDESFYISVQCYSMELYKYWFSKESFEDIKLSFQKAEEWRFQCYVNGLEVEKQLPCEAFAWVIVGDDTNESFKERTKILCTFISYDNGRNCGILISDLIVYIDAGYPAWKFTDDYINEKINEYFYKKQIAEELLK